MAEMNRRAQRSAPPPFEPTAPRSPMRPRWESCRPAPADPASPSQLPFHRSVNAAVAIRSARWASRASAALPGNGADAFGEVVGRGEPSDRTDGCRLALVEVPSKLIGFRRIFRLQLEDETFVRPLEANVRTAILDTILRRDSRSLPRS